jgi:hypothetical protein
MFYCYVIHFASCKRAHSNGTNGKLWNEKSDVAEKMGIMRQLLHFTNHKRGNAAIKLIAKIADYLANSVI